MSTNLIPKTSGKYEELPMSLHISPTQQHEYRTLKEQLHEIRQQNDETKKKKFKMIDSGCKMTAKTKGCTKEGIYY